MVEKLAKAVKSFYHGKEVKTRRSAPFSLSEQQFKQLKAKGMVVEVTSTEGDTSPKSELKPQSASLADPASQQKIANQSDDGSKVEQKTPEPEKQPEQQKPSGRGRRSQSA